MKVFSSVLVTFLIGLTLVYSVEGADKIKTTVLYESLCPNSRVFIVSHLDKYIEAFHDYLDIELVPFGKANSINNGAGFQCQHGPRECAGNLVQSCGLKVLEGDQTTQVKFAKCQMQNTILSASGKKCAEEVGADFAEIQKCVNDGEGIQLQLVAEKRTNEYKPKWVPSIIFDDVFDVDLSYEAEGNFKSVICRLTNNAPSVC